MNRRTSIFDQESKQISLLNASHFPLQKIYVVNGAVLLLSQRGAAGAPIKDPVQVFYKFKNEEKAGLGMPLPAGTIRVYQADSRGGSLFAGEDHIDHTPKDEDDQPAHRQRLRHRRRAQADRLQETRPAGSTNSSTKSRLRNHKDIPITVEVNEPIGGDWEMLNSTYKFTKTAAFAAQFDVPVDKDGTSVLKYRVRVKY